MSCYEEARGTIRLPMSAVPQVRRGLNAAQSVARERARTSLQQSIDCGAVKIARGRVERQGDPVWPYDFSWEVAGSMSRHADRPTKVTKKALDAVFGAPGTNRTAQWADTDSAVDLAGRDLIVMVPSNNHALDYCQRGWVIPAVTAALRDVAWVRRTGGVIWTTDEYAQVCEPGQVNDMWSAWQTFGPLGDTQLRRVR